MKKIVNILSIVSLVTSGVVTSIAINPVINNNVIKIKSTENKTKILEENIINLEKIDQKLVLNTLMQQKNNVILNYKLFLDKNLTNQFIKLIKDFQFENMNVKDVKQLLLKNELHQTSTYSIGKWKVSAESPRKWYEWIGGIWRLEFNHELIQDIIYTTITFSDLIGIVGEAGIYGAPAVIVSAILNLASFTLERTDLGNGILFRFAALVIPTQVTNSTHNWN